MFLITGIESFGEREQKQGSRMADIFAGTTYMSKLINISACIGIYLTKRNGDKMFKGKQ